MVKGTPLDESYVRPIFRSNVAAKGASNSRWRPDKLLLHYARWDSNPQFPVRQTGAQSIELRAPVPG